MATSPGRFSGASFGNFGAAFSRTASSSFLLPFPSGEITASGQKPRRRPRRSGNWEISTQQKLEQLEKGSSASTWMRAAWLFSMTQKQA